MKKTKRIKYKNLPNRFPLAFTLVCILGLDYLNAPGWLWGVIIMLLVFLWVFVIIDIYNSNQIDIFEDK